MRDQFGREIDYLRVSITDRCNLRCSYCMPGELPFIPHDDILRYEEIMRILEAAARLGVKTIRVTGGEPLMRKGCTGFIGKLKATPGIEYVTMTTNAALLAPYIDELAALGLDGLNVSLDSMERETYAKITGRDELPAVLSALDKALDAGLRVKLNCVPIKGVNERDILPIARLAQSRPVSVRFIKLMPSDAQDSLEGVPGDEIIDTLRGEFPDLAPDNSRRGFGPARYFTSPKLAGSIGIIDAVNNHFCDVCNRLRLTSEGFLKLCLHQGGGVDLRTLLRGGASDAEIESAIERAVWDKPKSHNFDSSKSDGGIKTMSRIGG